MDKSSHTALDWMPPRWFAARWGMRPEAAGRKLIALHALKGVPKMGKRKGLRYHVDSVQQALLEQED